jgi:predicted dehydrogenase
MLRVAVVGLGGIGRTHTRCYDANPDAQLVALCDMLPDRVDPVAKEYGVPAYHDLNEMLRSEQFDAVSVATAGPENGGHHYEPTMQLLSAGKHVLVEKPISNNIDQAREMVAAAKERGLLLGVDLNHRFTPAAERAKKLQTDGELGGCSSST